MPAPNSFEIDELVRNGQLTAAAEDKKKQLSASPVADRTSSHRERHNGHDSVRSTSDHDHASPRESHYSSSRGSPREPDYSHQTAYSRRHMRKEQDRRESYYERDEKYSRDSRHRHRSRSPHSSRHTTSYRERSSSRDRERSHRYERRDRSRSRDRRDNYERRPYSGRSHRESREAFGNGNGNNNDGSDMRSVFVQQLAMRVSDPMLERFFSEIGAVEKAHIIRDRKTGRSKGQGYVQFRDIESVEKAVGMTGRKLMDIPVIVSLTEAEKNRQAKQAAGPSAQNSGAPFHRLYVGNIHFSITENDLKDVFGVYGELAMVNLTKDENGRSRGYAYVQFIEAEEAKTALAKLNGFELAGRPMRVGLGKEDRDGTDRSSQRSEPNRGGPANGFQGSDFSGAGGRTANARANTDRDAGRGANGASGAGALDDNESSGVNYSNYSRHALMKRLAREEDTMPVVSNAGNRATAASSSNSATVHKSNASRCVLVKNAFNEAEETDPKWVEELEEDFQTECTNSYGKVVFCSLYRDSPDGEIYLKFIDVKAGDTAIKGLSGRNFGGRMLRAEPVVDAIFNTMFPAAANL